MTIPTTDVLDAIEARLNATGLAVARGRSTSAAELQGRNDPNNAARGTRYTVLAGLGGTSDTTDMRGGSLADPSSDAWVQFRLTTVAKGPVPMLTEAPTERQAGRQRDVLHAAVMDLTIPITGAGWELSTRTHLTGPVPLAAAAGEGDVVNLVDDYKVLVVAR